MPRSLLLQNLSMPHPLLQNLVNTGVVDESNVFSGAGDDNNDLLQALINVDLPGG